MVGPTTGARGAIAPYCAIRLRTAPVVRTYGSAQLLRIEWTPVRMGSAPELRNGCDA
ncbi:hypothetical protein [Streptomyces kaempferi]|uniref:Uncharacterized protein n=1 Tax=Streptomyces kaempferi TaxID=333725 RepID=A0ABW3XQZ6_9ACTN